MMNVKRYLAATGALFIFIFFYEYLVHGVLLMGLYEKTPTVWRTFDEMKNNMPLAMIFQLALSAWIAFAFTQIFPEGGWKRGVLFGLFFGVFAGILMATWYLWLPVPAQLGAGWFAGGIGEWIGGGIILGLIYRKH
jgi:hypothetical protein